MTNRITLGELIEKLERKKELWGADIPVYISISDIPEKDKNNSISIYRDLQKDKNSERGYSCFAVLTNAKHNTNDDKLNTREHKYKQLRYDMLTASLDCGIDEHPRSQMVKLGYKILDAVPQSWDCWWFTVEEFITPLEPYLTETWYNFDYWHNECWATCDYFKENNSCCYGGVDCKKRNDNQ